MFFDFSLLSQTKKILQIAEEKNLKIAIAESCTGGLLSALFTEIPGSSKVLECGFVVYSNQAKIEMLAVNKQTLEKFGAVSEEIAQEMAQGVLKNSAADIAIAITGIAGPDGGSDEKPVGFVYIALNKLVRKFYFSGNRHEIRKSTLISALQMIENAIQTRS